MKDHLLSEIQKGEICVKPEEIRWVLTVPAIWDDRAKRFMRDAAEQVMPSRSVPHFSFNTSHGFVNDTVCFCREV
jgi:hypothetical protein